MATADEIREAKQMLKESKGQLHETNALAHEMFDDAEDDPTLPPTSQVVIQETEEMVSQAIKSLREIIDEKDDKLCFGAEDALLLRMLRARKFDVQRAYKLLHDHMEIRIGENLDPKLLIKRPGVQEVLRSGFMILPDGIKDKRGRQMLIFDVNEYEVVERVTDDDVIYAIWLILEIALENEHTQRFGVAMVCDLGEMALPLTQMMRYELRLGPRIMKLMVSRQAARFGEIFVLQSPWYIRAAMKVVSVFISEKLKRRMHVWASNDLFVKLSDYFVPEAIEKAHGGEMEYDAKEWGEKIIALLSDQSDD